MGFWLGFFFLFEVWVFFPCGFCVYIGGDVQYNFGGLGCFLFLGGGGGGVGGVVWF